MWSLLLEMKKFLNIDYDEIFTQELKLLIVELLGIQVMKMMNHLTLPLSLWLYLGVLLYLIPELLVVVCGDDW